jgi:hypothetical protein
MARSSRGTPTNWSPDQFHPSQIDDSDASEDEVMSRRTYALAALLLVAPMLAGGLVVIAALERWRAWRRRIDGSR